MLKDDYACTFDSYQKPECSSIPSEGKNVSRFHKLQTESKQYCCEKTAMKADIGCWALKKYETENNTPAFLLYIIFTV